MTKASGYFWDIVDGRAVAETNLSSTDTTYIDSTLDLLSTPIYAYQSVPVVVGGTTLVKYIQTIRSEVTDSLTKLLGSSAIDKNDNLWAWGDNTKGQLGNNTITNSSTPVSVFFPFRVRQITTSVLNNLFTDYNGYAWGYGYNNGGCLGDGTSTDRSSPVSVIGNYQFVKVSGLLNNSASFGLDMSGKAWAWGNGTSGQLGDGTTQNRSSPVSVVTAANFVAIDGNLAIDTNNDCWSWGDNSSGAVGDGTTNNRSVPVMISGGFDDKAAKIANGGLAKYVLDANGYCYSWGTGGLDTAATVALGFEAGTFTDESINNVTVTPSGNAAVTSVKAHSGTKSCSVSAGYVTIPATTTSTLRGSADFTVEGWFQFNSTSGFPTLFSHSDVINAGDTQRGCLLFLSVGGLRFLRSAATGWTTDILGMYYPTVGTWTHIAMVRYGATVTIYCNGASKGSFSVGAGVNFIPSALGNPVIGTHGPLYSNPTYNMNGYIDDFKITGGVAKYTSDFIPPPSIYVGIGALGNNATTNTSTPVSVVGNHKFKKVVSYNGSTLALDAEGIIWAWGYNGHGNLGTNSTTTYSSPVTINQGTTRFIDVGINYADQTSVALDTDGKMWAWGGIVSPSVSNPAMVFTNNTFKL